MGGGARKIPYPKHVWSPAGGWYAQPANWKRNTAFFTFLTFCLTAWAWKISAETEFHHRMPDPNQFYPSRYWTKQIIEYEKAQKALKEKEAAQKAAQAAQASPKAE